MTLYDANGDSRIYFTVNLNKKYVTADPVPYSVSLIFHVQSYSLVRGFNNPINFWNTEVQHCFTYPFYKLILCFAGKILFDELVTKSFGNQSKKFFGMIKIWWTWWLFKYKCTNIFQSLQGLFGILRRAVIHWNSLTKRISAFVKSFRLRNFYYLDHLVSCQCMFIMMA